MKIGDTILQVEGLSKAFSMKQHHAVLHAVKDIIREFMINIPERQHLRKDEFWALKNINFELKAGTSLGIIGHNGSGKSTLLNILMGAFKPTQGTVTWYTNKIVLIDQHTALNPTLTGRENIINKLSSMGESVDVITKKIDKIIEFSGVSKFIDSPFAHYSSGMRLKLIFSIYAHCWPDVFIIDEALEVGDISFREKFNAFIQNYLKQGGTMILVSHKVWLIRKFCQHCILLNKGKFEGLGQPEDILPIYHKIMGVKHIDEEEDKTPAKAHNLTKDHQINSIPSSAQDTTQPIIQSITIRPLGSAQILPGCRICIEMICHSEVNIHQVGVTFTITHHNNPVSNLRPKSDFYRWSIQEGKNIFKCEVSYLPLMPGEYRIMGGLIIKKDDMVYYLATFGVEKACIYFQVEGWNQEQLQHGIDIKSTIHMDSIWE